MRTSLNNIKAIEAYLSNTLTTGDRLVFEARLLISKHLRSDVAFQREAYSIIQHHHRATLKQHFNVLHDQRFHDPSRKQFKNTIITLFKS